jgi:hypothetical protein
MKQFSRKLFFLFLGVSLTACSQKKETMINQNPHITSDNIVEELAKQVNHYDKETYYVFRVGNQMCYVEIFINDISVYKQFNEPACSTGFDINHVIYKSGTQKLTYKLYPVGKVKDSDVEFNYLTDGTKLELELGSYDNKNTDAEDVIYKSYKTPVTVTKDEYGNGTDIFIGTGKTYYEGSFTFEVQVPHALHPPFENAKDLRKEDPIFLQAQLLKKYKEIWNVYQNKEYDNIAKTSYDFLKNQFQAEYASQKFIKEAWDEKIDIYKSSTFEMQPLEKYKMEFFANGRLVALILDSNDNRFKRNSALWAKVNRDGGLRPYFSICYFYIPEGETEFKVY